jgi:periplasmic protein TonB
MMRQPKLQPDDSGGAGSKKALSPYPGGTGDQELADSIARLTSTFDQQGIAASAADLALDLVLHEIAQQACLATTSSGAAIALVRGEELVCRAASGVTAPDLGTRLDTRTGLSGICVQTRSVQISTDTEFDSRVDLEASRHLGVRSILVFPIIAENLLVGIFEVFSPRPHSFGDRDVQTVQALSRRVIESVRPSNPPPASAGIAAQLANSPSQEETNSAEVVGPVPSSPPETLNLHATAPLNLPEQTGTSSHDYATTILTAAVIVVALILGWVLGSAGWKRAVQSKPAASARAATNLPPRTQPLTAKADTAPSPPSASSDSPHPAKTQAVTPSGGLVVYQEGKVVFRMPPSRSPEPAAGPGANGPLPVSSDEAVRYLVHRVQPEYPVEARTTHVQGPVVLSALVTKDGAVEELRVISGNPLLVSAAVMAVKQWKFKPYLLRGVPVEFETRITVNFTMP